MLLLIGAGINGDLTLAGINELRKCDAVYAELYTNPMLGDMLSAIEKQIGKKIIELKRERVESDFLVLEAKGKRAALLVSGDPLIATTHVVLLTECKKKNIPVAIIHNSSIYTAAAGKAGLQIYRFGKTASLVNPRENYKPTSSLDIIRENLKMNLHTLVLLDTEPEPMSAKAALKLLLDADFGTVITLSRLGAADERISFGKIHNLLKNEKQLGKRPFTIIIPAKLHIVEEEYLKQYQV
jgi:diphthine synthase